MQLAPASETPLEQVRRRLPELSGRLRDAGRYIVDNEFDVATRSMREIAGAAGLQPATFTRLAQALGHSGWDALRERLIEARRPENAGPFSGRRRARPEGASPNEAMAAQAMRSDSKAVGRLDAAAIVAAAEVMAAAPRIWIAGYRSCRSVAILLHYQLRLFRPDDVWLVGGSGPEDCDFGAFRPGDAVIVIGFDPYSRISVQTSQAARVAGATLIAVADRPSAPIAEGARHLLLFEPAHTPAFFPSLAGAISTVQALAAVMFELGGTASAARLGESEARLAALSQYVPSPVTAKDRP